MKALSVMPSGLQLAARGTQHRAEHVRRQRIMPSGAWSEAQRYRGDAAQVLFEADAGPVDAVRDAGLAIDALALLQEAIGEARGVGQQMADRDDRLLAIGARRREVGQEGRHRIVEVQKASLGQSEGRDGDDRLGHAGKAEDGVHRHGRAGFAVGEACCPAVEGLPVAQDQHDHAHQALGR
jgi:hypothetical protein